MTVSLPLENDKLENFPAWYDEVVIKAQIVDNRTLVKGANVLLPNGYAIWENIQRILDKMLKDTGHKNAYFPIFLPEELLEQEAEHFEGFAPEVAWVTQVGDKKLERKVGLRPTSEAIMYSMFCLWIKSHADLPLKINQWCNIIRWDTKDTKMLLRDREFLWHEGHTVHANAEECEEQVMQAVSIYKKLFDQLCLPYIIVKRPRHDTFPGADYSIAFDTPLPDGKVLQIGTAHNLGQNFSKAFKIRFENAQGKQEFAYQSSYGVTTRLIGAILSVHGDQKGAVFPPSVAGTQIIIIPIYFKGKGELVVQAVKEVHEELKAANFRVDVDLRDNYTPGWKFNQYELLGVPLRIEIGPKDVEKNQVVLVRRDNGEKIFVNREDVVSKTKEVLDQIQQSLRDKAWERLEQVLYDVKDIEEMREKYPKTKGIVRTNWCGSKDCADELKAEFAVEIRGTLIDKVEEPFGNCVFCNEKAKEVVYLAAAY